MTEVNEAAKARERAVPDQARPTLRGLDEKQALRCAADVLDEVAWQGAELNPDAITAADFLALL